MRFFLLAALPLIGPIALTPVAAGASTSACAPPSGFVDTPAPTVAPAEQLVAHTEEILIDRPLSVVLSANARPLQDTVHKTSSLPGVSGEYMLTKGEFGGPGSRRLNCLTDGSTLEEQVLERERSNGSFRFRYVVWNYTTEKARPIQYGVGDFLYSDVGGGNTHVTWTYSFKLNEENFPGYLGGVGRFFFRVGFLDREYADLMRETLDGIKTSAERWTKEDDTPRSMPARPDSPRGSSTSPDGRGHP